MGASRQAPRIRQLLSTHRADACCLTFLVLVALAFFAPALRDGSVFGGFDLDTGLTSLGSGLYASVHSHANGDAVSQMVTWNTLDWRLIHSGHFPLWNDYSVLGMPQFFNFESSVLSAPDLVSYLVPLRDAFLVVVVVKVLIAGTGTYLAARVLGLRPVAALFGGVSFMLAGAFVNWVTWPLSDVMAWAGYLLAFTVLAGRSRRWRYVVLLAVAVAFSIYGGFPEANVMLVMAFAVLGLGALAMARWRRQEMVWRSALRPLGGALAGVALAAPLWLPGLQLLSLSHRAHDGNYVGLPTSAMGLLFSQGYDGLPNGASLSAYVHWPYYESVAYVGVIAIVLALVALGGAWRRPLVAGLWLALLFSLAATYEPRPFQLFFGLVDRIPLLQAVRFERMRAVTAFLVALLGAIGLEELCARPRPGLRRAALIASFGVCAVVGYLLVDSLGVPLLHITRHQRLESLIWPVVLAASLLLIGPLVASGWGAQRLRNTLLGLLVAAQSAFLFTAGVGVPTYGHAFYATTPAIASLETIVGSSLVGLDNGNTGETLICGSLQGVRSFGVPDPADCTREEPRAGLYPNINVGYGIRLFGVHDPLTPAAYFATWPVAAAAPVSNGVGLFVPAITSAALARRYGISYILAPSWVPRPTGTRLDTTLAGDERLYVVPDSARFLFPGGGAEVTKVTDGGDGSYQLATDARRAARLVMAVTALPGWHVTIDGHPAALAPVNGLAGVELSTMVPAGRHQVELAYLPRRLPEGIALALVAVVLLALGGFAARRRELHSIPPIA